MASKYGNAKPTYKGIEFDSGLEMLRYRFLERKLKAGQITELRRQVRYPLIPAQFKHPFYITNGNGKKMPEPGKEVWAYYEGKALVICGPAPLVNFLQERLGKGDRYPASFALGSLRKTIKFQPIC